MADTEADNLPPELAAIPRQRWPEHVAIIMDGNGRWATRRGLPRVAGHHEGADRVHDIVQDASDLGIRRLTLFAFSHENWNRPKAEVDILMHIYEEYLKKERPFIFDNNIRFTNIGRRRELPQFVRDIVEDTERRSADNTGMTMTLAVNYGGRQEIVDAARHLAAEAAAGHLDPAAVDEQLIASHLYPGGSPEVDLLIRTAGEMRVSNFLLWQISYAELYVTDVLWPDFTEAELHKAILDFAGRERRFGGLGSDGNGHDEG